MNNYAMNGDLLYNSGHLEKAKDFYKKALEDEPDCASAYLGLGAIYFCKNEFDKSINFSLEAVKLAKKLDHFQLSNCFYNLAKAYKAKKEIDNAIIYYKQAILLNKDNYDAWFGLSVTFLLNRDFKNGFGLYESRFSKTDPVERHPIDINKEWKGEDIKNKVLYVCYEQGYGDTIQFVRYLKALPSLFETMVMFKPRAELEELFKISSLNIEIVAKDVKDSELEFDAYIHLLSIPKILNVDVSSIPLSDGYLNVNKTKVNDYKNKHFNNEKFKLGIVWKGNPDDNFDKVIPIDYFVTLLNIPDVKIYSFQKEITEEEYTELEKYNIENLGKTFVDFSDTAAALENLDLLISADTSVAHLAGALNKPVWILLSYIPEWRWFLDSKDTPWYHSAKLYRQDEARNWSNVFDKILSDLQKKL